jgi:hypothetical protein
MTRSHQRLVLFRFAQAELKIAFQRKAYPAMAIEYTPHLGIFSFLVPVG